MTLSPTSAPDHDVAVRLADVTLGYNRHPAIHHLEGRFLRGSLTAVAGPNGSGKSTLVRCIAGLQPPMSGSCSVAAALSTAWLPQQAGLDRSFPARVLDIVALGLWPRRGLLGRHRACDRDRIAGALDAVGLAGFATRAIDTLSGGQLQRALFARVIVQDAQLILLDEPFNAVDERTIRDLTALIHGWQAEGRTVIAVMHDLALVRAAFPSTLLLARQSVGWGATAEVLTPANLARARRFQEAWDDAAPWCVPHPGRAA